MPFYVDEVRTFIGPAVDSEEHPIVSWDWDFGDGSTGAGQVATHTFSKAGRYIVKLTTINDCSSSATCARSVAIQEAVLVAKVLADGGFLDGIVNTESEVTEQFGMAVSEITMVTLFAYSCKTSLIVGEEKVAEVEAGYNEVATKAVEVELPTDGKDIPITLKSERVRFGGSRFASTATIVGF